MCWRLQDYRILPQKAIAMECKWLKGADLEGKGCPNPLKLRNAIVNPDAGHTAMEYGVCPLDSSLGLVVSLLAVFCPFRKGVFILCHFMMALCSPGSGLKGLHVSE